MKTAFLLNASLRFEKKVPSFIRAIEASLNEEKEIFVVDRKQADSTEKILSKIADEKFDRIVVAAGDGTLNRAVNGLARINALEKMSIGIVPFGTCNDFARHMGYRAGKFKPAFDALRKNALRRIGIAKANGHYFINNAGFGKRYPSEKRKSSYKTIKEMKAVNLKIAWDKQFLEGKFMMMLCANAPFFSGGFHFSSHSDPSDNTLEFFFVKAISTLNLLMKFLAGRSRMPMKLPYFSKSIISIQASKLSVQSEEPLWIVADGEPVAQLAAIKKVNFEIARHCNFIVPQ